MVFNTKFFYIEYPFLFINVIGTYTYEQQE
jgi:hypothetical protein